MADGRLLFDTKLDTSGFTKGLKGLGGLAKKAMFGVGKAIVGVTAGLTAFGISAIKTGMEFEAQMSRVQAISGATSEELEALNKLAIKLGADTAFSAKEAAEGMENLASAGFNTNEIMDAMPGLLDLAAVSGGDVAMASENAASALRAFGLEAGQAGHIADVFARAAADTNAEVEDMGYAMKYVAPVAKAMGHSLEETAAAIGIMSDAGVKGSQAGTTLRGALSRLAKPTKNMKDVMADLGLSFFDAKGNMKPLAGIISELERGTKGLTQEQKNQAIVTLFGQQSLSGMLALIDAGPGKLQELTKSLKESDGAAQEMAKTMQNNLSSQIEQLGGSFETLKIKIFQSVDGPLNSVVGKLTEYVNKMGSAFSGIDEDVQKHMNRTGQSFEELGYSAAEAKGGIEGVVMVLGDLLVEALTGLLEAAPSFASVGVSIIQTLVSSITQNIPQITSSIAGLASVMLRGILEIIPQLLVAGIQIVSSLATSFSTNLPTLIPVFITGLQNIANALVENIPILIPAVVSILTSLGQLVVTNLPILLQAGLEIIKGLAEGLLQALPQLLPQVVEVLLSIVNFITDNIQMIVDVAVEIIVALVDGLIQALPELIPAVLKMITAICDAIISNLPKLIDAGLEILIAIAQGIIDQLPYLIEQVPRIINTFTDALMSKLPDLIIAGVKILIALGKGLIKAIPTLIANIPQIIMAIINAFTLSSFFNLGKNLIKNVGTGIKNMTANLSGIGQRISNAVVNAIKGIFSGGANVGRTFISSIGSGISGMLGALKGIASTLARGAINAIKGAFSGAASIGKNLIQGIWSGISSMTKWIKNNIFGFAKGITSSIKKFFGIKSPSKVMNKEVGKWLPPGIAIGFDDSMPALEKDIKKQMNGLTSQMQKEVEAESTLTAGKIAANSNVYLPNPYDRKQNKDGTTAMVTGDVKTTVELDGRAVGYSTSRYSSEEMVLLKKRMAY